MNHTSISIFVVQEKITTKSIIYQIIQDLRLINIKIKVQEKNEEAITCPLKLSSACNFVIISQQINDVR